MASSTSPFDPGPCTCLFVSRPDDGQWHARGRGPRNLGQENDFVDLSNKNRLFRNPVFKFPLSGFGYGKEVSMIIID